MHNDSPQSQIRCPPDLNPLYRWFRERHLLSKIIDSAIQVPIFLHAGHGMTTTNRDLFKYLLQLKREEQSKRSKQLDDQSTQSDQKDHSLIFMIDGSCMSILDLKGAAVVEKTKVKQCHANHNEITCRNAVVMSDENARKIKNIMLLDRDLIEQFKQIKTKFEELVRLKLQLQEFKPTKKSIKGAVSPHNIDHGAKSFNALLSLDPDDLAYSSDKEEMDLESEAAAVEVAAESEYDEDTTILISQLKDQLDKSLDELSQADPMDMITSTTDTTAMREKPIDQREINLELFQNRSETGQEVLHEKLLERANKNAGGSRHKRSRRRKHGSKKKIRRAKAKKTKKRGQRRTKKRIRK